MKHKIHQIIKLFFENNYPEETRTKFFHWFFQSGFEAEKEAAIAGQWNKSEVKADASTKESYEKVLARLDIHTEKSKKQKQLRMQIAKIAATLLIPILSFAVAYWYIQTHNQRPLELVEYFTPNSTIRIIELPDGSSVTMNCGSIIIYPRDFKGNKREIFLSGEAKFDVHPDKKKPFIVKTNDMDIEALGTVFNISSYAENSQTAATLISGKVKVDMKEAAGSFLLDSLQQVIFDRITGQAVKQQGKADVTAWEEGHLIFRNASIDDIIQEVQRKHDIKVYANYKEMENEKFTVKFANDESLSDIFGTLRLLIPGFDYKIEGDKVYISR